MSRSGGREPQSNVHRLYQFYVMPSRHTVFMWKMWRWLSQRAAGTNLVACGAHEPYQSKIIAFCRDLYAMRGRRTKQEMKMEKKIKIEIDCGNSSIVSLGTKELWCVMHVRANGHRHQPPENNNSNASTRKKNETHRNKNGIKINLGDH